MADVGIVAIANSDGSATVVLHELIPSIVGSSAIDYHCTSTRDLYSFCGHPIACQRALRNMLYTELLSTVLSITYHRKAPGTRHLSMYTILSIKQS